MSRHLRRDLEHPLVLEQFEGFVFLPSPEYSRVGESLEHDLLRFLALRMESNAQYEIREYARTIGEKIVSKWVPMAWEAFQEYQINSVTFSRTEQQLLTLIYAGRNEDVIAKLRELEWIKGEGAEIRPILETREFLDKLRELDIDLELS